MSTTTSAKVVSLIDYKEMRRLLKESEEIVDDAYEEFQAVQQARRENDARMESDRRKHNERTGKQYKLPVKHTGNKESDT